MIAIDAERKVVAPRRLLPDHVNRVCPVSSPHSDKTTTPTRRIRILVVLLVIVCAVALPSVGIANYRDSLLSKKPELVLSGVVENHEIRLGSKVGGRIAEVCVSEGEIVEEGQLLLRLDVPELTMQREQLSAVKANVEAKLELAQNGPLPEQIEAAQADLELAESQFAEVKAGHRIEEIAQAKLDVTVHNSEESRSRKELDRTRQLRSSNSVSQSEMDSTSTAWEIASGQAAMAKQRLRLLEAGSRIETISAAQAKVRRARADLNLLRRATRVEELKQLESQIQEINWKICESEQRIAESNVVAPSKCTVEVIPVRKGDLAQPNQPVMRVRALGDLWIKAYVPETELGHIRLNQHVQVTHDGETHPIPGTVIHFAAASEFTPRNIQSLSERQHQVFAIKVRPQDPEGILKSGMAAQVRVSLIKRDFANPKRPNFVPSHY